MKLGSLFDGSGGFPLASSMNGIKPVWAAEVEPYPVAVTRSRFPAVKHYGNVCDISGAEVEPVDIITAGSPCQDLSVAGLRAGIYQGKRSNLFFESIRIVKEMRTATNGKYPRYFVWENVPGAFSADKGGAFQAVLEAVCSVRDEAVSIPQPKGADGTDKSVWLKAGNIVGNGYSVAWRVFDAQYWGVPQRRARIYLIADFDSERAAEILFKSDSLRGNMQQGNAEKEEAAVDAVGFADGSVGVKCLNPWDCQSKRVFEIDGIYPTLPAMDCGGANNQAVIYEPASLLEENWQESEVKNALRANASKSSHAIIQPVYAIQGNGVEQKEVLFVDAYNQLTGDISKTLNTGVDYDHTGCVCYDARGNGDGETVPTLTGDHQNRVTDYTAVACFQNTGRGWWNESEVAATVRTPCGGDSVKANLAVQDTYQSKTGPLMANSHPGSYTGQDAFSDMLVAGKSPKPPRRYIIRRLMPVECARLQGFPDKWGELAPYDGDDEFWEGVRKTHTEINGKVYKPMKNIKSWYEKLHNDGAEYKMWGNGIALPCAEFIMWAIVTENTP
jgi:DNA (cytosine-5)-methyltransferase 1